MQPGGPVEVTGCSRLSGRWVECSARWVFPAHSFVSCVCPASATPTTGFLCNIPVPQLWSEYCAWQRLPQPAVDAGTGLLRGLLGGGLGGAPLEQPHSSIEFEAVEVEGYFR